MRRLSIKHRLIANTVSLVIGLLIMLGLNQYQASQQRQLAEAQRLNEALVADMLMLRRNEKDFLMREEARYLTTFETNVATLQRNLESLHDILQQQQIATAHLDAFGQNIRAYQQGFVNVVTAMERLRELSDIGMFNALSQLPAQATLADYQAVHAHYIAQREALGQDENSGLMGEMRSAVHATEVNLAELSELVSQALMDNGRDTSRIMLLAFLAVLAGVVWLNIVISRSIIRPIVGIETTIQAIARSQDLSVRLDTQGADEVSSVAVSFNQMMETFESLIRSLASAADQLAAASHELSAVSDEASGIAHAQEGQTTMIATAVTQMAMAIQEVAGNALAASEALDIGASEANAGQQTIAQNIDSMQALQASGVGTGERLQVLNERINEISNVVNVIQAIAEQTNLLALNAAIEAARAGEHGRGFAVVADEVRNLAANTKASTETIHATTERLLQGAREAIEALQVSTQQATESAQLAEHAGGSFTRVHESIQQVTEMGIQISTATEEQSTVAQDITENVNNMADSVREVVTGAEQCAASSQELARLASQLQDTVAQFKVS